MIYLLDETFTIKDRLPKWYKEDALVSVLSSGIEELKFRYIYDLLSSFPIQPIQLWKRVVLKPHGQRYDFRQLTTTDEEAHGHKTFNHSIEDDYDLQYPVPFYINIYVNTNSSDNYIENIFINTGTETVEIPGKFKDGDHISIHENKVFKGKDQIEFIGGLNLIRNNISEKKGHVKVNFSWEYNLADPEEADLETSYIDVNASLEIPKAPHKVEQNIRLNTLDFAPLKEINVYGERLIGLEADKQEYEWEHLFTKHYDYKPHTLYDRLTLDFNVHRFYVQVKYWGFEGSIYLGFPQEKDAEDPKFALNDNLDRIGRIFNLRRREYKPNLPETSWYNTFPPFYPYPIEQDYCYEKRLNNEYLKGTGTMANNTKSSFPANVSQTARSDLNNRWERLDNVLDGTSDSFATAPCDIKSASTNTLSFTDFDLDIPKNAIIRGIVAECKVRGDLTSASAFIELPNGEKSEVQMNYDVKKNFTTIFFGGSSDTWGLGLQAPFFKDPDFSFNIYFEGIERYTTVDIEYLNLYVYYRFLYSKKGLMLKDTDGNNVIYLEMESPFAEDLIIITGEREIHLYESSMIDEFYTMEYDGDITVTLKDKPRESEEVSKFLINSEVEPLERFTSINMDLLAIRINRNSRYLRAKHLREGTGKLKIDNYRIEVEGLHPRIGTLKSDIYHTIGVIPVIKDLSEYLMKWNYNDWDTKWWTGGEWSPGIFRAEIPFYKIPSNFKLLEKEDFNHIIDRARPLGTKGAAFYEGDTHHHFNFKAHPPSIQMHYDKTEHSFRFRSRLDQYSEQQWDEAAQDWVDTMIGRGVYFPSLNFNFNIFDEAIPWEIDIEETEWSISFSIQEIIREIYTITKDYRLLEDYTYNFFKDGFNLTEKYTEDESHWEDEYDLTDFIILDKQGNTSDKVIDITKTETSISFNLNPGGSQNVIEPSNNELVWGYGVRDTIPARYPMSFDADPANDEFNKYRLLEREEILFKVSSSEFIDGVEAGFYIATANSSINDATLFGLFIDKFKGFKGFRVSSVINQNSNVIKDFNRPDLFDGDIYFKIQYDRGRINFGVSDNPENGYVTLDSIPLSHPLSRGGFYVRSDKTDIGVKEGIKFPASNYSIIFSEVIKKRKAEKVASFKLKENINSETIKGHESRTYYNPDASVSWNNTDNIQEYDGQWVTSSNSSSSAQETDFLISNHEIPSNIDSDDFVTGIEVNQRVDPGQSNQVIKSYLIFDPDEVLKDELILTEYYDSNLADTVDSTSLVNTSIGEGIFHQPRLAVNKDLGVLWSNYEPSRELHLTQHVIQRFQYVSVARNIRDYIETYKQPPAVINTAIGGWVFGMQINAFSIILQFYHNNSRFPNTLDVAGYVREIFSDVSDQDADFSDEPLVHSGNTYTLPQIREAANRVRNFIVNNNRLPSFVTINNNQVDMPSFLYLMSRWIVNVDASNFSNLVQYNVNNPKAYNVADSINQPPSTAFAGVELSGGGSSRDLHITGFNLSIPSEAQVLGIEVEYMGACRASNNCASLTKLQLVHQGSTIGTSKFTNTNRSPLFTTSSTIRRNGGSNDHWGTTLNPSIINSPTFGVELKCAGSGPVRINGIRIKVYYRNNFNNLNNIKTVASGALTTGNATHATLNNYDISENTGFLSPTSSSTTGSGNQWNYISRITSSTGYNCTNYTITGDCTSYVSNPSGVNSQSRFLVAQGFNLSSIPDNAVIDSVDIQLRTRVWKTAPVNVTFSIPNITRSKDFTITTTASGLPQNIIHSFEGPFPVSSIKSPNLQIMVRQNSGGVQDNHLYVGRFRLRVNYRVPVQRTIPVRDLQLGNFNFDLPDNLSSITGISVEIDREAKQGSLSGQIYLRSPAGTLSSPRSFNYSSTRGTVTVGGKNDNWGLGWSRSMINSPNFRLVLVNNAMQSDCGVFIGHIKIKVHYSSSVHTESVDIESDKITESKSKTLTSSNIENYVLGSPTDTWGLTGSGYFDRDLKVSDFDKGITIATVAENINSGSNIKIDYQNIILHTKKTKGDMVTEYINLQGKEKIIQKNLVPQNVGASTDFSNNTAMWWVTDSAHATIRRAINVDLPYVDSALAVDCNGINTTEGVSHSNSPYIGENNPYTIGVMVKGPEGKTFRLAAEYGDENNLDTSTDVEDYTLTGNWDFFQFSGTIPSGSVSVRGCFSLVHSSVPTDEATFYIKKVFILKGETDIPIFLEKGVGNCFAYGHRKNIAPPQIATCGNYLYRTNNFNPHLLSSISLDTSWYEIGDASIRVAPSNTIGSGVIIEHPELYTYEDTQYTIRIVLKGKYGDIIHLKLEDELGDSFFTEELKEIELNGNKQVIQYSGTCQSTGSPKIKLESSSSNTSSFNIGSIIITEGVVLTLPQTSYESIQSETTSINSSTTYSFDAIRDVPGINQNFQTSKIGIRNIIAQSFIANNPQISGIRVELREATGAPSNHINLEIRKDLNGNPDLGDDGLLAERRMELWNHREYKKINIYSDKLNVGERYWIVFRSPRLNYANYCNLGHVESNQYSNGGLKEYINSWSSIGPNYDLRFQVLYPQMLHSNFETPRSITDIEINDLKIRYRQVRNNVIGNRKLTRLELFETQTL